MFARLFVLSIIVLSGLALPVIHSENATACHWSPLPYSEPACDMLHPNSTGTTSLAKVQQILATGEKSSPGKCVACLLAGVWGTLTAANLEALNIACNFCSCNHETQDACEADIKVLP